MGSIWTQHCQIEERKALEGRLDTQVAVVGAGMAGILIASALERAGRRVVVLEADRIAGGQTRNTTAKITSQHGMIYAKLIRTLGAERARQYAMANEAAVQAFRDLIAERNIDCGFEERDAYLYGNDAQALKAEAEAAAGLGLPAGFVREVPLPFPTAGAVRFARQAQFHPLKFLKAVAGPLTIFEHTPVRTVKGTRLLTDRGEVRADQVVFACHYPFVNFPGLYFARMHQERSYVLALEGAPAVDGMFIGAERGNLSLRTCGGLLLLGGGGHRTGENTWGGRYDHLRRQAKKLFPGSRETACWSAQDCVTPDSVPYIGRYAPGRPEWYVATGFQKWGMTSSMAAALLLGNLLCGREDPNARVFDPGRFGAGQLAGMAAEGGQAVKGLARYLFQFPEKQAADLPPEHGGIVFLNGKKRGVYKDGEGKLHPVGVRCPHLGCQVEWNPDERSWDCPCHGSRFDCSGKLLSGPAQEDLGHG